MRNVLTSIVLSVVILASTPSDCFPQTSHTKFKKNLTASYYTYESCRREGTSGVWTASGERFDENDLTCALRSRSFGRSYRVTNLANGKSVVVRHNDFGPNKRLHDQGRVIDLSKAAFQALSPLSKGVINVKVEAL